MDHVNQLNAQHDALLDQFQTLKYYLPGTLL